MPPAEVKVWFNASSVLCVPWREDNDGLPNVVLETMARGVPCVASRFSWVANIDALSKLIERASASR